VTIGITHAPYRRVLDAMTAEGAALVLAGHTHGGQLRVPGVGALVTNCDLPRRQARGVSSWVTRTADGERHAGLHVSAGLGTSPYTPVRFACRPEASLLTLTPSTPTA
jgi:predicted MPP superfamily phosphohydrolase